ncbi:hypothetical protein SCOR_30135 [Sulfidibacter corallicola]|uniref:Uncharacterized protein n=1 Tax=Sulfidibacter corallicola TaxID=2818388 RepID=A0A8A4TLU9_SULCO|nr:hypothetical protein [Sulfidibacter corallicola]QTD50184.1 hypothetical protein J3U87_31755 [Sulfidibacter corallicola]
MRPGFSYAVVLAVLLLLTIFSFLMLGQFRMVHEVEYRWWALEQATLNSFNAVNAFTRDLNRGRPRSKGTLTFTPENGFAYEALPFGPFWLVRSRGYAGGQDVTTAQVVGSGWPQYAEVAASLEMDPEQVRIGGQVRTRGRFLFSRPISEDARERLVTLDSLGQGSIDQPDRSRLAEHLQRQDQPDWLETLATWFPDIQHRDLSGTTQLRKLPEETELSLFEATDGTKITGTVNIGGISFWHIDGDLVLERTTGWRDVWIVASDAIRIHGSFEGSQVHLVAPVIDVQARDFACDSCSFTAFDWQSDGRRAGGLSLSGEGSFSGALVALGPAGHLDGRKAGILISRNVDTQGLIWSAGRIGIRGRHQGAIVADHWVTQDGSTSFQGLVKEITLEPLPGLWSPWLPVSRPTSRVVTHWEVSP